MPITTDGRVPARALGFPQANSYDLALVRSHIMGPNPLKLCKELLADADAAGCALSPGSLVLDLGSGAGITSAMLAAHGGVHVIAADLWGDPTEVLRLVRRLGLDARDLPFAEETFDAVTCIDAYAYFGRDEVFLGERLLPLVRHGGCIYLAILSLTCDVDDFGDRIPLELACS